jgi:hypothetical protein
MRDLTGSVGIRMEMIAGEIGTVTAKINVFLTDALIDIAWFCHAKI